MTDAIQPKKPGKLVCVGTGIRNTEQITLVSKTFIENADVVFGIMPNSSVDAWMKDINPNYINLQEYYAHGKVRTQSYLDMADAMLEEVRAGKDVCFALYGHPGVIATVGHLAIGMAKEEGFATRMEPGISAEDCLFADIGLDPGYHGCLSYETTDLLFHKHTLDPNAVVVLWQISLAGEYTLKSFSTSRDSLILTVEFLSEWYDLDQEVIIYEAAFFPDEPPRLERLALKDLPDANLNPSSTLVIIPNKRAEYNQDMLDKFGISVDELGALEEGSEI